MSRSRPNFRSAASESPPPTIEVAFDFATAVAISRVPVSNGFSSKTPIGPFQKTVEA